MNCEKYKLDMLDFLSGSSNMPRKYRKHLSACEECNKSFCEAQSNLQSYLKEDEFKQTAFTDIDVYVKSIMPSLNKKSAWLQEQKQQRFENVVFAAMIVGFIGLGALVFHSYVFAGNPWPIYIAVTYMLIASIVSVMIIPQIKKEF